MDDVFKKLQLEDADTVYVRGAPKEFRPHLDGIASHTHVRSSPSCQKTCSFVLFFVKSCAEVSQYAELATSKLDRDGQLWFAYPKKSSKRYQSDLSRDSGWQPLGDLGFESVRQVAIDQDWSALRFRHVEYIPKMARDASRALSRQGRKKASS